MKAYAYFDINGVLKEFIIDPSLRQGNRNVNDIMIYMENDWNGLITGDATVDENVLDVYISIRTTRQPEPVTNFSVLVDDIFYNESIPLIKNYDPKYFKYGKKYNFIKVNIPSEALAVSGNAVLTTSILNSDDQSILNLGIIPFAIEESALIPSPTISWSEYLYLLSIVSSVNNKINKSGTTEIGPMDWMHGSDTIFEYVDGILKFNSQTFTWNNKNIATENYVDNVVNGLASKSYVDSAVAGLASETYVTEQLEIALNDYATKTYVQEQILNIDLTSYETKTDATAKYNELNGKISDVRNVAEGKCKSYTISINDNAAFNTQDLSISGVSSITDISGNIIQLSALKNGDVVLIIETDKPDRWFSASDNKFYVLETAKVDLSDYYNKEQVDDAIANSFSYGGYNTISDANDAELNKFYWISGKTTNFPNNNSEVGLLMNMGYSSSYRTQIYILGYASQAPKYYVRNIIGSSWTSWYQLANEEGLLRNNRQNYDVGPNDADNAVNNTFVCVVNKTTNYPYANASGFLYTNYSLADDRYGIQMFISRTTNNTYGRPTIYVRSKNNNVFYKWHKLAIEGNPTIQLSMFKSIAACGDSYTAGYSVDKDGTIREKAFQNSWMRTLARKNGIFGGIYAKTGVTTSGWLTDSDCLPALQADSNHYELYIIFLGFNDSVSDFGTAEDIDLENPLNSADTSCGNFAKIKYYIGQKDPNAKIVICKLPYGGANTLEQVDVKNPLIEACATKLGVGCASIPDFPGSNDNIYKQSNHGTNIGYSYLASAIEYGVCKALAMTYYIGFSYDSTENVNKNYNAFLKSLYNATEGDAAKLVTEDELAAALDDIDLSIVGFPKIPVPASTTLTADEISAIQKGCQIDGNFLNLIKPTFYPARTGIAGILSRGMYIATAVGGNQQIGTYQINESTGVIGLTTATQDNIDYNNVGKINNKQIPAYPTANTSPQIPQIGANGGALSWVDPFNPTSVAITDGGTISDTALKENIQYHRPIVLNGYTGYYSCDDGTNYQYASTMYDASTNSIHFNVITINKSTWVVTFHTKNIAL